MICPISSLNALLLRPYSVIRNCLYCYCALPTNTARLVVFRYIEALSWDRSLRFSVPIEMVSRSMQWFTNMISIESFIVTVSGSVKWQVGCNRLASGTNWNTMKAAVRTQSTRIVPVETVKAQSKLQSSVGLQIVFREHPVSARNICVCMCIFYLWTASVV